MTHMWMFRTGRAEGGWVYDGRAGALLIAISILKMVPKGTKFEEVSDIMQSGFGLLAIWIMAVSILNLDGSTLLTYVAILGLVVGIGMGIGLDLSECTQRLQLGHYCIDLRADIAGYI